MKKYTDTKAAYPVVMYDVEDKKAVGVFSCCRQAGIYVWGIQGASKVVTRTILAKQKYQANKNPYNRVITFRSANPEYSVLLEGKEYVILDNRFLINNSERKNRRKEKEKKHVSIKDPKQYTSSKRNVERDKKIVQMAREGYTLDEIAQDIDVTKTTVMGVLSKEGVLHVHGNYSSLSVEELQKRVDIMNVRINRLKKENNDNRTDKS